MALMAARNAATASHLLRAGANPSARRGRNASGLNFKEIAGPPPVPSVIRPSLTRSRILLDVAVGGKNGSAVTVQQHRGACARRSRFRARAHDADTVRQ